MAARKKVSGFVTEAQRHTKRVVLRLRPEVADLLYSLSTEIGEPGKPETLAATIEQALAALNREMAAESESNEAAWSGVLAQGTDK